jgi:hypothetical protein
MIDRSATRGVLVISDDEWVDDGDAYTLEGVSRPTPTSAPTVTSLLPATAVSGDPPLDVLVKGTGFVHGDRVVFGGSTPPTSYHSDDELAVRFDPADWQPGVLAVLVGWSSRGPSNAVDFTVT